MLTLSRVGLLAILGLCGFPFAVHLYNLVRFLQVELIWNLGSEHSLLFLSGICILLAGLLFLTFDSVEFFGDVARPFL